MLLKNANDQLTGLVRLSVILTWYLISTNHVTTSADVVYIQQVLVTNFAHERHHESNIAFKHKAKDFIVDELKRFGFKVEQQEFNITNVNATFYNVIGIIEGVNFGSTDDNIVGIGAHYDTSKNSPGTDDNGSGVTAMLEVGRQLKDKFKDKPPRNTILFVAFDKEAHDGSLGNGTRVFMAKWLKTWIYNNYKGMPRPHGLYYLDGMMEYDPEINTQNIPVELEDQPSLSDTVKRIQTDGSRGDFIAVVHRQSVDLELASHFYDNWAQAPDERFSIATFPLPFGLRIEDVPGPEMAPYASLLRNGLRTIWSYGDIPCVLLTDTAENRGMQRTCYQKHCDNMITMLKDDKQHFLAKSADVLTNTIYNLSQSRLPNPTKSTVPSTTTAQPTTVTSNHHTDVSVTSPDVDTTTVLAPPPKTDAHTKSGCSRNISDIMALFITIMLTGYIG